MRELVIESAKIFQTNTPDKWNAFLELIDISQDIRRMWFEKLQAEMIRYFNRDHKFPKWSIASDRGLSYVWFLEEFSRDSVTLWLEDFQFSLWVNQGKYNISIINELLATEDYRSLISAFGPRAERIQPSSNYLIRENVNWDLGSPFDGNFDEHHLAWFAGNETEKLVIQIAKKLDSFFNEEITKLMSELNSRSIYQKL